MKFISSNSKTDFKAAALEYASDGWKIFPIKANSKLPATENGFKDASSDLGQIDTWWDECPDCNIAMSPEDQGLAVIDWDTHKGHDLNLDLPKTQTVGTPSGGRHFYFRGSLPASVEKLGPGIDTRGQNSYVLLPPSEIDSRIYQVTDDRDPAPLPESIADKLRITDQRRAAPSDVQLDLPGNIARARRTLDELIKRGDVAIAGQGGNVRTYKLSAELIDLGLSPERALALLMEPGSWNEACQPPWSQSELKAIVSHALDYRQNDIGSDAVKSIEQAFPNVEFGQSLVPTKKYFLPERQTFTDVLAKEEVPVEYLVPNLIEKGIATALSAPGGHHKSRLALQIGLCLQSGVPVLGEKVEPATFVYISYEDREQSIVRRAKAMQKRLELPAENAGVYYDFTDYKVTKDEKGLLTGAPTLMTITEQNVILNPLFFELVDELKKIHGHKFVVFDSTYNVLNFLGATKSDETLVRTALGWLDYLCRTTNSTVAYLWHPSYAGQGRGDASGWSVAWNNAPRSRLSLTRKGEGLAETFVLKVEKHNDGPPGYQIELQYSDGALVPVGQNVSEAARYQSVIDAAKEAAEAGQPLKRNGAPNTKGLSETTWQVFAVKERFPELDARQIRKLLDKAVRQGHLAYLSYVEAPGRIPGYYPAPLQNNNGTSNQVTSAVLERRPETEEDWLQ